MAQILIGTQTTDANGVATFANLPDGQYKYVEVTSPTGYDLDTVEYSVTVSGGTVTAAVTNVPHETGSLTVHKHISGDTAQGLAGATFNLTKDSKEMQAVSIATDANGDVSFDNLMSITGSPQSYTVQEVTPPVGYLPSMDSYTVSVAVGGTPVQNVPNVSTGTSTLDVSLSDVNYQSLGLQGSSYNLYYVES